MSAAIAVAMPWVSTLADPAGTGPVSSTVSPGGSTSRIADAMSPAANAVATASHSST
ncbi:hypothetical protein ACFQX6_27345 [Streptosporangium lutulentum]